MSYNIKNENNDCKCCKNYPQLMENNKISISFIVHNYNNNNNNNNYNNNNYNNNTSNNDVHNYNNNYYYNNTTNNDVHNYNNNYYFDINDPRRNYVDPVTNSHRRYLVTNFLKSVCLIRNKPFNFGVHRDSIQKICEVRKSIEKEEFLPFEITLTDFIHDCQQELLYLDSYQSSLVKDIQMFYDETRIGMVPSRQTPSPSLPPYKFVRITTIPSFTYNSTIVQNSLRTLDTRVATSGGQTINNNNSIINNNQTRVTATKVEKKVKSEVNNSNVKVTKKLSKKTRTTNKQPVVSRMTKRIKKEKEDQN
ncbi:hypothetical protein ACTFIZ_002924 [Dictyostelium cf. discoideum]